MEGKCRKLSCRFGGKNSRYLPTRGQVPEYCTWIADKWRNMTDLYAKIPKNKFGLDYAMEMHKYTVFRCRDRRFGPKITRILAKAGWWAAETSAF